MIVNTMNQTEIHEKILTDFQLIQSKYIQRLGKDYDKTRRKNKIPKETTFSKCYEFRTHAKNNWLLIFSKAPSDNLYKGQSSINILFLVHHYTNIGLRVFKVMVDETLSVYNSHLFVRYNERMNLNIVDPLEKVKHFFTHNGYSTGQIIEEDNKQLIISVCKDGYLFGEIQNNQRWIVYKTFIPEKLAFNYQKEIKEELEVNLQKSLDQLLKHNEVNRDEYFYRADVFKGIKK